MIENNRWYSNVERASAPCQTRERGLSYFCQLIKVDFEIYSRSTYKNKKSLLNFVSLFFRCHCVEKHYRRPSLFVVITFLRNSDPLIPYLAWIFELSLHIRVFLLFYSQRIVKTADTKTANNEGYLYFQKFFASCDGVAKERRKCLIFLFIFN